MLHGPIALSGAVQEAECADIRGRPAEPLTPLVCDAGKWVLPVCRVRLCGPLDIPEVDGGPCTVLALTTFTILHHWFIKVAKRLWMQL